jgi:UDP-GlcNAc:undecaprenyl-phosphate/decaprenyl-phosphate GlcNAc-1-phosphate transferase
VVFYLMVPMVLSLGRIEPAGWATQAMLAVYDYAFGALALFTVMTLKFTRREKGFKATPMDFLILLIALVAPNLPDSYIDGLHKGYVAVKLIVLYFSFEVLIGELRGDLRKIALGVLAALVLLAVRGSV